jgi:hypothetical protein
MPALEQELRELGLALAFPETPDVAARVRLQLEQAPEHARRRRSRRGRALVLAFAILLLGAGTVLAASPDARDTLTGWFSERIPGVVIRRVPNLPRVAENAPLQLPPRRADLAAAARTAGFRPLVPSRLGDPDRVYADGNAGDGVVVLLYRPEGLELARSRQTGVGALVTELHGSIASGPVLDKMVGPPTVVQRLRVDGRPAMWIGGAPHMLVYNGRYGGTRFDERRLAGNVLLVEEPNGVLVRIEAQVSKARAVEIARSLEER